MKKTILKLLVASMVIPSMLTISGCNNQGIKVKDESQIIENLNVESTDVKLKLTNDISISNSVADLFALTDENAQNIVIDLGGKTLSYSGATNFNIADGSTLTIKNGKMNFDTNGNVNTGNITVYANSKLILDNVEYYATGNNIVALGEADVIVNNSKLSGQTYCISTNAAREENYNPNIKLKKSELTTRGYGFNSETNTSDYDDATIMINVPGNINIENCKITGNRQSLIVRGGEVSINDSELINTGLYENKTQYLTSNWGSGDEVPMAVVVLGNRSGSYQYSAKLTLANTKLTTNSEAVPTIYAYSSNPSGKGATLKYKKSDAEKLGIENAVINEESNVLVVAE